MIEEGASLSTTVAMLPAYNTVFHAAFFLRYYETKDAVESAIFASCAVSFVVEKEGVEGIPYREEVEKRMEKEGRDFLSFK